MHQVGSGVSNFTAQNLAAEKPERIKEGFKWGLVIAASIGLVFFFI